MASSPLSHPNNKQILETLQYFDKYDYPLTREEVVYWSGVTPDTNQKYYFLVKREKIVATRHEREKISQTKWQIANQVGELLRRFTTIQAIFITGSLSMNNASENDDIDLMIVTTANTLWTTRFLVNIFLTQQRRYPNQRQVTNKICPNLWLDENSLTVHTHNLYTAHEILQAKVLWDRDNIQQKFLAANEWVKEYLPNAYKNLTLGPSSESEEGSRSWVRYLINYLFFAIQYLYMLPKMTTEHVGLGFAYFHPVKHSP